MTHIKKYLFILSALLCSLSVAAQDTSMKSLALDDLSAFKPNAGNWRIVGDVSMNRNIDIHPAEQKEDVSSKKKKSKEQKTSSPQAVTFSEGKGILLNLNDASKKDNLVTNWEHGDIDIEFDVMLPKGSNSGIYLQGRYEVQLFDSWGVKNPTFADIGGIYRNWENTPNKIYSGKAPLSNPSKAPGLWQKMRISFRAPKFDAAGNKIAHAQFIFVELNGVRIHDHVEVPLPTGGPIENNEKPLGPLMIQGDHGPVAFRNIRYKTLKDVEIGISDIAYKIYHGNFKSVSDFKSLQPELTGSSKDLSAEVIDVDNAYGIVYSGNITIPQEDEYTFELAYSGGGQLKINNEQLFNFPTPDGWRRDEASLKLKPGTYSFEFSNFKDASWMPPRLAFIVKSPNIYPKSLQAFASFPPDENPVSSIYLNPGSQPKLLRAFLDFKGDRSQRLTHTIGVGDPSGIHYVYDLKAGNLVCVWRGDFVDATPMWHDRGDGSFLPRGAVQFLFANQPLAALASPSDAFPKVAQEGQFRSKGYEIDESTGRPVFKYIYQGVEVDDKVYADDQQRTLVHEVTITKGTKPGLYYKLAEGSKIDKNDDGSFAVDDKQYYIVIDPALKATVRDINGKKELVVPVEGSSVKYSIIW
jgi:hypothetical protein